MTDFGSARSRASTAWKPKTTRGSRLAVRLIGGAAIIGPLTAGLLHGAYFRFSSNSKAERNLQSVYTLCKDQRQPGASGVHDVPCPPLRMVILPGGESASNVVPGRRINACANCCSSVRF